MPTYGVEPSVLLVEDDDAYAALLGAELAAIQAPEVEPKRRHQSSPGAHA